MARSIVAQSLSELSSLRGSTSVPIWLNIKAIWLGVHWLNKLSYWIILCVCNSGLLTIFYKNCSRNKINFTGFHSKINEILERSFCIFPQNFGKGRFPTMSGPIKHHKLELLWIPNFYRNILLGWRKLEKTKGFKLTPLVFPGLIHE